MFLYKNFVSRDAGSELDDIQRNLGFLLSSKQGCGSFLESFGVTETGYRTPAEMVERLSQEIRDTVARYEPRIEITEIDEEHGDEGGITLVVYCRVRTSEERLLVRFNPGLRQVSVRVPARSEAEE